MRTTVTLDPDVERLVRDVMRRTGKSFKETVNQGIRRGLGVQGEEEPPFSVQARPMGLRAGIDTRSFNKLVDEMEIDSFAVEEAPGAERSASGDSTAGAPREQPG